MKEIESILIEKEKNSKKKKAEIKLCTHYLSLQDPNGRQVKVLNHEAKYN